MPTDTWFEDNPKVSAYISKNLKERLNKFKEDRNISISQALTIILSEYFGVDQEVDYSKVTGSFERVEVLEQKLAGLSGLVEQRFQYLEQVIESISLLVNQSKPKGIFVEDSYSQLQEQEQGTEIIAANLTAVETKTQDLDSSPSSKPTSELVGNAQTEWQKLNDVLPSELPFELLKETTEREAEIIGLQENLDSSANAPEETKQRSQATPAVASSEQLLQTVSGGSTFGSEVFPIMQPLSSVELSSRLKVAPSVINRYKNGQRRQSLAEWSRSVDPEGIAWAFSEELGKYVPTQNISDDSTISPKTEILIGNQDSITEPYVEQETFNRMPLTGEQLAARFGMNSKRSLDNHRTGKQAASFPEWTQSKDPDGIVWHYARKSKMYYPIELPSKLLSKPKPNLLNFEASADSADLDNQQGTTK